MKTLSWFAPDQLNFIKDKKLKILCHGQCYQKGIARAYDKS